MQNKPGQIILSIARDIQVQNFRDRNPSNFCVGNLENPRHHKFILTLSDFIGWQKHANIPNLLKPPT